MPPQIQLNRRRKAKVIDVWSNVFLSNWLFLWVWPLIANCYKNRDKGAKRRPKFRLRPEESAKHNVERLQEAWGDELKRDPSDRSLLRALRKSYGYTYALVGIYKIVWGIFTWLSAYWLLKQVVLFIADSRDARLAGEEERPISHGHAYAVALLIASLFSSVAIHQLYAECNRIGTQVRSATTALVYRKSLRLSRIQGGAGEIINIYSTDVTRLVDAVSNFHFLWTAFLEAIAIIIIAFCEVGLSAFPCLAFVLLLLPIQVYLGNKTSTLNRNQTSLTTSRVHIMSEILTAIKLIKFYAWESPFDEKISTMRRQEMSYIRQGMIVKTINFTVVFAVPVFVALSSLGMYVALDNVLTATISFTILSVYNTLRYPFLMLPLAVRSTAGAMTALERLNVFLNLPQVDDTIEPQTPPPGTDLALSVESSDFKWDGVEVEQPTLSNVNLHIKKGSKVAIVGDVGSGKSSLIAALLGQIRLINGPGLKLYGRTAYMSQEAWLLNITLRDNILFGKEFERERYNQVVKVCALQRDLTLLLAGDKTEIAERGANLSGGQRQRVSLARCVYHDSDILLLDDPLSAVDQHVGVHIFDQCFMEYLKNKTVIVAMNQLQYLQRMDHIIVMKEGRIDMQGSYAELTQQQTFNDFLQAAAMGNLSAEGVDDDAPSDTENTENAKELEADTSSSDDEKKDKDQMYAIEEAGSDDDEEDSAIPLTPTKMHGHAKGASYAGHASSTQHIAEMNQLSLMSRNQLSVKFKQLNEKTIREAIEKDAATTIRTLGSGVDIAEAIRRNEASVYSTAGIEGMDDLMNENKGRLVSEDASANATGWADFGHYFRAGPGTVVTILTMCFFFLVHGIRIGSDYWLRLWVPRVGGYSDAVYLGVYGGMTGAFALGVFLRGLFWTLINVNKATELHQNIFDAVIRAPMSFFDKTPLGRILSAFSKHQLHVDDTLPDTALQGLQYAPLGLGALLLCAIIVPYNWAPCIGLVILAGLIIHFSTPAENVTKAGEAVSKPVVFNHLTATLEGLMSVRAYGAERRFDEKNLEVLDANASVGLAGAMVRSFQALYLDFLSSFVVYFTALLIVIYHDRSDDMPSVAGLALSNALQMLVFVQWTVRMWGEVQSQMSSVGQLHYYAQTPPEAPAVLPDSKCPPNWPDKGHIRFQDVVLRYTPNGVSVLKNINLEIKPEEKIGIVGRTGSGKSTLLTALLRIVEVAEGKIVIDGVDCKTVGLDELRSGIAIIPQEPVLFVGTVRSNLDPFGKRTDTEIWAALDSVHLGDKIRSMPGKLDAEVVENGKNFSVGLRQCVCIARAVLSGSKVLVLDEATAAIDSKTDAMLQETIRTSFSKLTVLTIAHRLNTIIDSDRVLFLDAGEVLEFDAPEVLLRKEGGAFRELVEKTGEEESRMLKGMADRAAEERKKKQAGAV
ncbi:P-loop containing nucleoside triphosphate hydrolase protein [Gaertneriomyces semiglobifer]|nr:P-loop containing nucleoside triphosphate hydrolase protein [Gaertneriomyces semiglobifer]